MRRLSFFIIGLVILLTATGQESSPHGAEGPVDCNSCHIAGDWWTLTDPILFDHDTTSFALNGAHEQITCTECHQSLVFNEVASDCATCHEDVHSGSVGRDCARCHDENSWLVNNIPEIHEQEGFPLTGSHSTLSCVDCHANGINLRFDRRGNDCINCHLEDFNLAQNPNHIELGYSLDCTECHDAIAFGWDDQMINHDFFPLLGGHAAVACTDCHIGGDGYDDNAPEDCFACHREDYFATTSPNHVEVGYSTTCDDCHTIFSWSTLNAGNHDFFPLIGGHAINDCAQCHLTENFSDTSPECVSCHLEDYNETTDPNHLEVGFSTDCMECHNINNWEDSDFNHDALYFPIFSGNHRRGVWNECTECHIQSNDYSIFSCLECHEHNRADMANEHDDVAGYSYVSTECLRCHPNGDE